MATNREERLEVAERLRDCSHALSSDTCDEFYMRLNMALFGDGGLARPDSGTFRRLADLIEPPEIDENTSDGYHTFRQLYYQRAMLFSVLVAEHKELAWKTRCHEDGKPCFGGGWFLVTIDTPAGQYGYHYEDKYWNLFDCAELPKATHWDGYCESDVGRLMSLAFVNPHKSTCHAAYLGDMDNHAAVRKCDACGCSWTQDPHESYHFCPKCGARIVDEDD